MILALIAMEGIIVQILAQLHLLPAETELIVQKEDQMKHGAHLASIVHLRHRFK